MTFPLTLFSVPRPFQNYMGVIQTNAIQSWVQLSPACEIILFGDDEGTEETARSFGIRHFPKIERNEFGTPLLNSLFEKAQQIASHKLMCYVNADIILMNDFLKAIQRIRKWSFVLRNRLFLMVGRRWNLDVQNPIDFEEDSWEETLRNRVTIEGQLYEHWGIDYFVFHRGLWKDIPPFLIGRTLYDNWLIYRARQLRVPVIDATHVVKAVHQNHDYGSKNLKKNDNTWNYDNLEIKKNLELGGGISHAFNLRDATWILGNNILIPALTTSHLLRRRETLPVLYPNKLFLTIFLDSILSAIIFLIKWLPRLNPYRVFKSLLRRIRVIS